jgi:ribonucleoside-triphosphate reductase
MIDTGQIIDDYLSGGDATKNNSNIGNSINALYVNISEEASKNWWMSRHYTPEIGHAHEDGYFHIHNLGFISTYCVGWNLEDLLLNGFVGAKGMQSSGPAKRFSSAMGQVSNFLFALQNEAAGAQAFSSFDTFMAPLIKYEGLDEKRTKQIIQEFRFSMNNNTRIGGQAPFTNITLDQQVPKHLKDNPVIVGGKHTSDAYGDFQDELDVFNRLWWESVAEGDFQGRTQPFPIETLNVTPEFNWDDEALFKAVAKRGSPYFANYINSDMKPEDGVSMCCRLRLDKRVLLKRGGGLFGAAPLTGSIGVVTLNMPLLAYEAKTETKFLEAVDKYMELAIQSLNIKRKVIEKLTEQGMYPRSKIYLKAVHDRFGQYWANHFNTIGLVGMNEALMNMFGTGIADDTSMDFAVKTLDFMRTKALDFQDQFNIMVNIEATPAEKTSETAARKARKLYRSIITAGVKEAPYFTNSTQLPVGLDETLGFYLENQSKIQPKYTGGTVFHIWNGERQSHWEGVSHLIRSMMKETPIPYGTYTPTTSICPTHGFMTGEYWNCPTCGADTEVWSRITGYFSEVHRWNDGKRQEFSERKHFEVPQ